MTNSEAVLYAKYFCEMCNCHDEVAPTLENMLKENYKLKADIKNAVDVNENLVKINDNLRTEINILESKFKYIKRQP